MLEKNNLVFITNESRNYINGKKMFDFDFKTALKVLAY